MVRQVSIGLLSGAAAILVLLLTRPASFFPRPTHSSDLKVTGMAAYPAVVDPPATRPISYAARRKLDPVEQKLDKRIQSVEWNEVALRDVLDWFSAETGVNMDVRWRALEAAGINHDHPIRLKLRDVTARRLLRAILAEGNEVKLGYDIDEGVLLISTADDLARVMEVRAYDVRDLLLAQAPAIMSFTPNPGNPPRPAATLRTSSLEERAEELLILIRDTMVPASWDGPSRSIRMFNGRLVVSQYRGEHRQFEDLLDLLRGGLTAEGDK